MTKIKLIIPFILLNLCLLQAKAQLDLPQLLTMADASNPSLFALNSRVDLSKKEVNTAAIIPETQIILQYGNIQNPGVADYVLGMDQIIINPSKNKALKKVYESRVGEKEAEVIMYKTGLHKVIRDLYYQAQYINDHKVILYEQMVLFREIEKYAIARVNSGETDVLEKISVQSQIHQLENKINRLNIDYQSVVKQISGLVKSNQDIILSFKKTFMPIEYHSINNPGVEFLKKTKETAVKDVNYNQSLLKPDFNAGLFNQSMQGNLRQFFITGGLQIPLFNAARKAKIETSKLNQQIIGDEIAAKENEIQNRLMGLQIEKSGIEKSIIYYADTLLPESAVLIQKSKLRYQASELTYLEFYQTQLMYARLQEELEAVWLQYHQNISEAKWLNGE